MGVGLWGGEVKQSRGRDGGLAEHNCAEKRADTVEKHIN